MLASIVVTCRGGGGGVAMWVRMAGRAAIGCAALALYLGGAEGAAASAWSIQPTPIPAGASYGVLSSVSCASRTTCTAVGYFTSRAGAGVALAEHWNGTRWSIQRTPTITGAASSLLFGVSCASTTACTAVGSVTNRAGATVPLAERWNGSRWSSQRIRRSAAMNGRSLNYLAAVSCASTHACVSVGYSGNRLGTSGVTLAARWDGTHWTIQPTPRPSGASVSFLSAVSCASPSYCTAVGDFIKRAGAGVTLALRWSGTRWSIQRTPTPAAASSVQLAGVSCTSSGSCTAVGFFSDVTGIEVMLAERWNGATWTIQRTRYPVGARYVQLVGVSCASPKACTAVGFYNDHTGIDVVLAERWNGTTWTIQPIGPAGAGSNSLEGVSCPSKTVCTAVGGDTNPAGTTPVALRHTGSEMVNDASVVPASNEAICRASRASGPIRIEVVRPGQEVVVFMGHHATEILFAGTPAIVWRSPIIRRNKMKLSARNQLPGTVSEIRRGEAIANVVLDVAGQRLVASITVEAVDELGLAAGKEVTVIVKASDVILATD
jgi:molybdopterin-binding protein